jgi:hypothetical protein
MFEQVGKENGSTSPSKSFKTDRPIAHAFQDGLNISFCSMFIIIVSLLLVAIVKRQRQAREQARNTAVEETDNRIRHISSASRSAPRALAIESTAQLAHGLLGATGSLV